MVCDFFIIILFLAKYFVSICFYKTGRFEKQVFQCFKVLCLVVKVEEGDLLVKNAKVVTMCERKSKARGLGKRREDDCCF